MVLPFCCSIQKERNVAFSPNGLPLTTTTGEFFIDSENSLVPAFESKCGWHVEASLADDRVQVDIAGSSLGFNQEGKETATQSGIDGYANFAADLTDSASPLAATLEVSFLSDAGDGDSSDQHYFAGRSWMGFFDQRVEASAEVALSLDDGEVGTGFATKYEITADLWQTDNFSLSSFVGFMFADATNDRLVREFGASMNWGRMDLNLLNSLETNNVDQDYDEASNQRATWDTEVSFDLSDLHPFIPNNLSLGFEIERFKERDGGALAAGVAKALSRAIDLDLSWAHHGGITKFGLSRSMAWERSTVTDQADESKLEIGLGRSIEANGWSWSAEGAFSQELVTELKENHRSRSLSFDLGLDIDSSPSGSIGFEAGLAFYEGSDESRLSFGEASAVLTYDLQF